MQKRVNPNVHHHSVSILMPGPFQLLCFYEHFPNWNKWKKKLICDNTVSSVLMSRKTAFKNHKMSVEQPISFYLIGYHKFLIPFFNAF